MAIKITAPQLDKRRSQKLFMNESREKTLGKSVLTYNRWVNSMGWVANKS